MNEVVQGPEERRQEMSAAQPEGRNTMMTMIERVAMSPDADIDKLERLMAMKERWDNQQAVQAFNMAMSEMQDSIPSIEERGKAHNTQYATFEDINDVVKPIMKRYGFAVSFRVETMENQIKVTGVLMHQAGHREETSMVLPFDNSGSKNAVQSVGSSVSYGKRYVMSAMLNITTRGSDDDGNSAAPVKRVTALQARSIVGALESCSQPVREWFEGRYQTADNVPRAEFDQLMGSLNKRASAGGE